MVGFIYISVENHLDESILCHTSPQMVAYAKYGNIIKIYIMMLYECFPDHIVGFMGLHMLENISKELEQDVLLINQEFTQRKMPQSLHTISGFLICSHFVKCLLSFLIQCGKVSLKMA